MWPWYNGSITVHVIWLADTILTIRSSMTRRPPFLFWVNGTWLAVSLDLSLANTSDWLLRLTCPWQTLLIGCFDWPASRVFYWLLSQAMSDMQTRWRRKRLREGVFFAVTNTEQYSVLTCLWRLNRYSKRHLKMLVTLPGGGFLKLCSMLFCQISVSVLVM